MLFILPVGSENIEDHKPWANYGLVLVTVLAWWLGPDTDLEALRWAAGGHWYGLVTSVFVHVDFFHLLGNMIFLLVFGGVLAARMKPPLFLVTYLVCGVVASFVHTLASDIPAIGASGAVNGLIGVYFALFPLTRIGFGVFLFIFQIKQFRVPGWVPIMLWFVLDLYGTLSGGGGVAYLAHIGGFLCGLGIGVLLLRFGWFYLHPEDLRSLPELFGKSWRGGMPRAKKPKKVGVVTAPALPVPAPDVRTSRPPAPEVRVSRPPTPVRVSRPALEVATRREPNAAVAMTTLSCACGWSAEVPTIFVRESEDCGRCRAPLVLST